METPLYCRCDAESNLKASTSQSDVLRQLGKFMWKQLTHIALLTQQMRVTDVMYQEVLNRLREGECTIDDYLLLSSSVIGYSSNANVISNNALIVAPSNDHRKEINNYFVKDHAKSKGTKILVCRAMDICKNGKLSLEQTTMTRKLPNTQTGGLPNKLALFEGMSVYLTKNISTEIGLNNGTTGIVKQIIYQRSEKTMSSEVQTLHNLPQYVTVEFPDVSLTALSGLLLYHVPIFPLDGSFSIKTTTSKNKTCTISCKQLPLEPAYSCTSHKRKAKGKHYKQLLSTLSLPRE